MGNAQVMLEKGAVGVGFGLQIVAVKRPPKRRRLGRGSATNSNPTNIVRIERRLGQTSYCQWAATDPYRNLPVSWFIMGPVLQIN